jgi:hypothetical protein
MNVLVIDGQGGGLGRQLVAAISAACPEARLTAVGTNSLATSAMLKAGTVRAATGENAVIVNCRIADVIVGPIGIVIADALLGEITFCYELVDDGNNFFRNKEEYERTFQTWTTLANNALSRLRGVMDSDKRRWNGYMRDRKAKTP